LFEKAEQLHVEQDELHLRIADPLTDAKGGAVHAIGAVLERPERVLESETAVVVTVPIDTDLGTRSGDHGTREGNEVTDAIRRCVADGIRQADSARTVVDGHLEEPRQNL